MFNTVFLRLWPLFFSTLGFASSKFEPTILDLEITKRLLAQVSGETKLIVLSDAQHRLPNTRAATLLIAQALAEKFPKEQICLFFETTEKIDTAWESFKKSDGSEISYGEAFEAISKQISSSVTGLTAEKAGNIFVEPPFFMARYLKDKTPNISIFGVDVDYTDKSTFSTLYNNAKPPRKLDDNLFAKTFIADRNISMAKKTTEHLKTKCSRAILSAGNMHIETWSADKKTFPNYNGKPIPGVVDLIDKKITNEPVVFNLFTNRDRICPEGQARIKIKECRIEFTEKTTKYFQVELPKDFFLGHIHGNETGASSVESAK